VKIFSKVIIGMALIGVGLLTLSVSAISSPNKKYITGIAARHLVGHYSDLTQDELSILEQLRKRENTKVDVNSDGSIDVTLIYPAKQGMVFVNNIEAAVDENGRYSIDIEENHANVELRLNGKQIMNKDVVLNKGKNTVDLIESQPFGSFCE
jgi:hypothetical protein